MDAASHLLRKDEKDRLHLNTCLRRIGRIFWGELRGGSEARLNILDDPVICCTCVQNASVSRWYKRVVDCVLLGFMKSHMWSLEIKGDKATNRSRCCSAFASSTYLINLFSWCKPHLLFLYLLSRCFREVTIRTKAHRPSYICCETELKLTILSNEMRDHMNPRRLTVQLRRPGKHFDRPLCPFTF